MSISIAEKSITITDSNCVKLELKDYLTTYVNQYNQMVETFEWMKDKLDYSRKQEWERTIHSLKTICMALDAGFEPKEPPRNWSSGQLIQYLAPIPEKVREAITKAEPIFGNSQILIYDPNTEHFSRPRSYDPMAFGFINLANQRHHFLIGAWDLDKDLKFINIPKRKNALANSADNINGLMIEIQKLNELNKQTQQYPTITPDWTYKDNIYTTGNPMLLNSVSGNTTNIEISNWSKYMVGERDSFS